MNSVASNHSEADCPSDTMKKNSAAPAMPSREKGEKTSEIRRLIPAPMSAKKIQALKDKVFTILKKQAPALKKRGVMRAVLFGSVARGTAIPESDVDIALFVRENSDIDLFDIAEMERQMSDAMGRPVHLMIMRESMQSSVRDAIDAEGLPVF